MALITGGTSGIGLETAKQVRSLALTLGAELAPRGIRVNAVSPGPISTPFHGKLGLSDADLTAVAAGIEASIPLGRFGEASEIAGTTRTPSSNCSTPATSHWKPTWRTSRNGLLKWWVRRSFDQNVAYLTHRL